MARKMMLAGFGAAFGAAILSSSALAAAKLPQMDFEPMSRVADFSPLLILILGFAAAGALLLRGRTSLIAFGVLLGILVLGVDVAFAADAGTPETVAQATNESTKVTWAVGSVVSQWADAVEALLIALVAFALRNIPGQIGSILQTMRVDQVINKAIDYAINMVKGATKDKELSFDVGNEVLAKALQYVLDHSPGWLQQWMGGPDKIAEKIISRLNLAPDVVLSTAPAQLAGLSKENLDALRSALAKVG